MGNSGHSIKLVEELKERHTVLEIFSSPNNAAYRVCLSVTHLNQSVVHGFYFSFGFTDGLKLSFERPEGNDCISQGHHNRLQAQPISYVLHWASAGKIEHCSTLPRVNFVLLFKGIQYGLDHDATRRY